MGEVWGMGGNKIKVGGVREKGQGGAKEGVKGAGGWSLEAVDREGGRIGESYVADKEGCRERNRERGREKRLEDGGSR